MLFIDESINNKFSSTSANYNIRNCAGILPNNVVVFAISKNEVIFYDLANTLQNLNVQTHFS